MEMPGHTLTLIDKALAICEQCNHYNGSEFNSIKAFSGRLKTCVANIKDIYRLEQESTKHLRTLYEDHLSFWIVDGLKKYGQIIHPVE